MRGHLALRQGDFVPLHPLHEISGEGKGKDARTPRAPAGAHRPPDGVCVPLHPLLKSYSYYAGTLLVPPVAAGEKKEDEPFR